MEAVFDQGFGVIRQPAQFADIVPKLIVFGVDIGGIEPQTAVNDAAPHNHRVVVYGVAEGKGGRDFLMGQGVFPNFAVSGNGGKHAFIVFFRQNLQIGTHCDNIRVFFHLAHDFFNPVGDGNIVGIGARNIFPPPDFANSSSPMFKEAIKPKLWGLEIILILPSCSWKRRAMASVPSVEPSSTIKISKLRQV